MSKYIIIDGTEYAVAVTKLQRKADILDKTANRTEDGDLHREVIGTYYNYSLEIGTENDLDLYNRLFDVLSAPVAFHTVELPHDHIAFQGYFGSVQDEIDIIYQDGSVRYKSLTCNLVSRLPRRRPNG